jgi:hypothetical protein
MAENLNNVSIRCIFYYEGTQLHTSNKTSKIIVGSSLRHPRPLLGRPSLALPVLSALARPTLARLAGRSMRSWEEVLTTFTQGAQFNKQVAMQAIIALTVAELSNGDVG